MDTIKQQIQALDNAEFINLMRWMYGEEQPRREAQPVVEQAQAEIVKDLQDSGQLPRPEAATEEQAEHGEDIPDWVDPGTDHAQMYQQGDVVRFEGRVVRSTHPGLNHWTPGVLNYDGRIWEDITPAAPVEDDPQPGDGVKDYVQPTGAHDAYQKGAVVRFTDGHVYESLINNNTWSPEAYPQGWRRVD